MNRALLVLIIAGAIGANPQTPPSAAAGRGSAPGFGFGPAPVRSPEVSSDKRVTFRLRAPNAREVQVRGITPQPLPMEKNADGV